MERRGRGVGAAEGWVGVCLDCVRAVGDFDRLSNAGTSAGEGKGDGVGCGRCARKGAGRSGEAWEGAEADKGGHVSLMARVGWAVRSHSLLRDRRD